MSYQQKYRAGDPNNSHDPAALTGDTSAAAQRIANNPAMSGLLQQMMGDPSKMVSFANLIKGELADAKQRGETMQERILTRREKQEFARDDALSEKLKVKGNDAMRSGDAKLAFTYYKACFIRSAHEPIYWLNTSAACLKLKMYEWAEHSANETIRRDGNDPPKALFRRAQARRFLGKLAQAEQDIRNALSQLPTDPTLQKERDEIQTLQGKSSEGLGRWLQDNSKQTLNDVFGVVTEGDSDKIAEALREKESKALWSRSNVSSCVPSTLHQSLQPCLRLGKHRAMYQFSDNIHNAEMISIENEPIITTVLNLRDESRSCLPCSASSSWPAHRRACALRKYALGVNQSVRICPWCIYEKDKEEEIL